MSKREFARYIAAKRRLASAQNKADRLTVKTAEGGMRDAVRPSLILNAAGVAFRNIPNGVINCVTVDRKLKFRFDHFDGEVSWREPSTKPPTGSFVIAIK